jgi:glycosyltransferase involved in cell wall biosynthesis
MSGRESAPKISVITPCLNGARYVAAAVDSVLLQRYPNMEHIVVDGGSIDGTLTVLSRYPHLTILSGPDDGMYDALNKALHVARGELIGILNADDCYSEQAFSTAVDALQDKSIMAVAGEAVVFRDAIGGEVVVDGFTPAGADLLFRCTLGNPAMNAWFFRNTVFTAIGRFDAGYRVAGDREFMLRFALSGMRHAEVSRPICRYRMHSGSLTFGGGEAVSETVRREHAQMTDHYLRRPGLSKRARGLLRRARTRDTLRAAILSARRRDVRMLMSEMLAGTKHDPVWPARFVKRMLQILVAKIGLTHPGGGS